VASYRLQIKPSAVKDLEAITLKDRKRLVARIRGLAKDPRPHGCDKLSGHEKYRVRQGNYRILYSIDDAEGKIVIVKVGHRRDVYR
jgi:mRNA interferase RelE/StbE